MPEADWKHIVDKYLNNTCTREELHQLLQWVNEEPDNEALISLLRLRWEQQQVLTADDPERWNRRFDQLLTTTPPHRKVVISKRAIIAAAATVLLMLTTGITYYLYRSHSSIVTPPAMVKFNDVPPGGNRAMLTLADGTQISLDSAANGVLATQGGTSISKQQNGQIAYNGTATDARYQYNTMSIPKAGKYSLVLPDGSKIWLNSASSLRYPLAFGKERRVMLTGEAYFEIAPDAKRPFIVEVNKSELHVLGTSFNVMAYAEEAQTKTTLVDGALAVNYQGSHTLLKPGQQATITTENNKITVEPADLEEALAWKNDRFYFNNTDIRTAMRQLERWYDVDVTFRDTLNMRLNGTVSRTVSISGVLKLLTLTGEANFSIQGKTVSVGK
ncbi:FecR family protein [Chitinophaga jiangningensis]|uniref:FecR family protein n=2 Tax=Chitinophaga jiangningensis TaxID=1419482 RepID=A0A1M7CRA3_9BACT|nr:FecR family protein [Chitinophaga jiangningensis]